MKSFKDRFLTILNEEVDMPINPEDEGRPTYDGDEDQSEFEGSLDPDTEAGDYDVEGLDKAVYSAVDDTTEQVIAWADEIESFTKRLLDPENPDALLTKLTTVSEIPEYATAAEAVAKHLRKAVGEIGNAKTELDVLASMAGARRNARKASDATQTGPSGPY